MGISEISGISGISKAKEKLSNVTNSVMTAMPKCLQGNVGDTAVFQKAAYKSTLALNAIRGSAVEGSARFGLVNGAKNFIGRMGAVAKSIPVVGIAISTLFEVPAIIDGFKEGRGAAQIMKAGAAVTGATVGSIVGAAIGSVVPVVGTWIGGAIGAVVGGQLGDKVGGGLWGSNKGTAKEQPTYVAVQQPVVPFGAQTAHNEVFQPMSSDIETLYNKVSQLQY